MAELYLLVWRRSYKNKTCELEKSVKLLCSISTLRFTYTRKAPVKGNGYEKHFVPGRWLQSSRRFFPNGHSWRMAGKACPWTWEGQCSGPNHLYCPEKKAKMIKNYGTAYVYHGVIFVPDHEVSNKFWLHIITYLTLEVFQTEGKTKSEFGF